MAGDEPRVVRGRVLKLKKFLELEDEAGHYHRIYYDWIVEIVLLKHNRPHPSMDPELLEQGNEDERLLYNHEPDHAYR